ncbi:MAG: hypothetical protein ABI600_02480 [Luteolibacter sp.]
MKSPDSTGPNAAIGPGLTKRFWTAGARYQNGVEIWCAYRSGEDAWTTDRRLAAKYPSESSASMAAHQLTEGNAVPFWLENDS